MQPQCHSALACVDLDVKQSELLVTASHGLRFAVHSRDDRSLRTWTVPPGDGSFCRRAVRAAWRNLAGVDADPTDAQYRALLPKLLVCWNETTLMAHIGGAPEGGGWYGSRRPSTPRGSLQRIIVKRLRTRTAKYYAPYALSALTVLTGGSGVAKNKGTL